MRTITLTLTIIFILILNLNLYSMPDDSVFLSKIKNCDGCKILNKVEAYYPYSKVKIYKAKILKGDTIKAVVIDENGNSVNEEEVYVTEKLEQYKKMGAIYPSLWEKLETMNDDELIQVFIWLSTKVEFPDSEELKKDKNYLKNFRAKLKSKLEGEFSKVISKMLKKGVMFDYVFEYAPIIHATLTKGELMKIYKLKGIGRIVEDTGEGIPTSYNWYNAVNANLAHFYGITGNGVKIALQLNHKPLSADYRKVVVEDSAVPDSVYESEMSGFSLGFIKNSYNEYEIAPQSLTYMANMLGYSGGTGGDTVERWAINNGCRAIVYAMGSTDASSGRLSGHDMYVDYLVKTERIFYIASSGNKNDAYDYSACGTTGAYVQNKFYNGLIVGGSNDNHTDEREDDTIYICSSWQNPYTTHGDRELPEIVAPAGYDDYNNEGLSSIGYEYSGTSAAASIVGGIVALLYEQATNQNNDIVYFPEAIKGILMVSATMDVDGDYLSLGGDDEKDGAGEVDAIEALQLADIENYYDPATGEHKEKGYYYGRISNLDFDSVGNFNKQFYVKILPRHHFRAVVVWNSTASCNSRENPNYDFCSDDLPDADLDLKLVDENGNVIKGSYSWDNTYEYIHYYNDSDEVKYYELKLSRYQFWADYTNIAIVWDIFWWWKDVLQWHCTYPEECEEAFDSGKFIIADNNESLHNTDPAVIRTDNHFYIVAWRRQIPGKDFYNVVFKVYDKFGNEKSLSGMDINNIYHVTSSTQFDNDSFGIAPLNGNQFAVAWNHCTNSNCSSGEVKAKIFYVNNSGISESNEFLLVTSPDSPLTSFDNVKVAGVGNSFFVAWHRRKIGESSNNTQNFGSLEGMECFSGLFPVCSNNLYVLSSEEYAGDPNSAYLDIKYFEDGYLAVVWIVKGSNNTYIAKTKLFSPSKIPIGGNENGELTVDEESSIPIFPRLMVYNNYDVSKDHLFEIVLSTQHNQNISYFRSIISYRYFIKNNNIVYDGGNVISYTDDPPNQFKFPGCINNKSDGTYYDYSYISWWVGDNISEGYHQLVYKANGGSEILGVIDEDTAFSKIMADMTNSECCYTNFITVWGVTTPSSREPQAIEKIYGRIMPW